MVGRCGSGKSSVINTIIGEDLALLSGYDCKSTMPFHVDKTLLINSTQYHCHITEIPDYTCKQRKPVSHYINDIAKTNQRINLERLNLIIYVFRLGRPNREEKEVIQRYTDFFNNAQSISALVITHCDNRRDEAQARIVEDVKHVSFLAATRGKGVYPAACIDFNELDDDLQKVFEKCRQKTITKLHQLIEESSDVVDVLKVNNAPHIHSPCKVM